jgi:hypothetical protein
VDFLGQGWIDNASLWKTFARSAPFVLFVGRAVCRGGLETDPYQGMPSGVPPEQEERAGFSLLGCDGQAPAAKALQQPERLLHC